MKIEFQKDENLIYTHLNLKSYLSENFGFLKIHYNLKLAGNLYILFLSKTECTEMHLLYWCLIVAGSILAPAGIEGGDCEWTALSPPSIPWLRCTLSKAPNPQLLPGRWSNGYPLLRVCVHSVCVCSLLTAVCVHLDGLNAEDQFRVRVTILDNTSHTVGTESIQTPLNFSLFVILQPFAKII